MKVLVTGVNGQLGYDVINELKSRNIEYIGTDISSDSKICPYFSLDITDMNLVRENIISIKPDVIIHCAAYTQVDNAEDNKELVYKINALGTKHIAEAAKVIDAKMIYISTDYVFNGEGTEPWKPDSKDYSPLNVYGETKLEGEKFVSTILEKYFIVRIAWVFGENGNNFIKTMLKLSEKYSELRVVNDQIGSPTYTYDLSRLLVDMILTDKYGYYHATNEGDYISWYDFAKEIFKVANKKITVHPVSTKEYGLSKAKRPFNSRLDRSKINENGFTPLPTWKDAIYRYITSTILIKK